MDFWLNHLKTSKCFWKMKILSIIKIRKSCSSIVFPTVQCLTTAMFNEIQKQTDENVSEVDG